MTAVTAGETQSKFTAQINTGICANDLFVVVNSERLNRYGSTAWARNL